MQGLEHYCKKPGAQIGLLGGTFNPIHNAHLQMAAQVRDQFGLQTVCFIPANDPPHKLVEPNVTAAHRYAMVQQALQAHEGLCVCDIESHRPGKSYTVDTLALLHAMYPCASFHIIVGSDMLRDLPNWRRAADLFRLSSFIGVTRQEQGGDEQAAAARLRAKYAATVRLANANVPRISSTDIRARMLDAQPVDGLLPVAAELYAYAYGLYFPCALKQIALELHGMLDLARIHHTAGVVKEAIALAGASGVDTQKARLAALLHDCGRTEEEDALAHAAASARIARQRFGVDDEEVLLAIRLHTTLDADASALCKIIYLADMIEPGRAYPGVEQLRTLAHQDLDRAVCAALWHTIDYVRHTGGPVDPASLRALQWLEKQY